MFHPQKHVTRPTISYEIPQALRAAEVGGQGRRMNKETDTDSTSRCSTSSATPNYRNTEQATELNRHDLVNPLQRRKNGVVETTVLHYKGIKLTK